LLGHARRSHLHKQKLGHVQESRQTGKGQKQDIIFVDLFHGYTNNLEVGTGFEPIECHMRLLNRSINTYYSVLANKEYYRGILLSAIHVRWGLVLRFYVFFQLTHVFFDANKVGAET
jgi:hypothetical protein